MFPDLDEDNIGGAVGIIIPDTISQSDREIFESILTEITTAFKTQVGSAPDPEAHEYCMSGRGGGRVCRVYILGHRAGER